MDLRFESFLPEAITEYAGDLVLTTKGEAPDDPAIQMLYYDEILGKHPTIITGMIMQRVDIPFGMENLVIGVDPGRRIGLSIFYRGREIESSSYSSIDGLASHLIEVINGLDAEKKIVRIGSGEMKTAREIAAILHLEFPSMLDLEFVDEDGTSPKIKHHNQRGKRDQLSARYISQRQGRRSI